MPTNQTRREAAQRKLERQLARRAELARKQRQRMVIGGVVAVLLVGGGLTWLLTRPAANDPSTQASTTGTEAPPVEPATPCSYPTDGVAAAVKEASAPTNLAPLNVGTVDVDMTLNGTTFPVTLNRELAPCGVNSFLSLAAQGFYDDTDCWRLTTHPQLQLLQCGDPSGQGNGGPGYAFGSEVGPDTAYPRGTIALANAGAGTTGSQFFITSADSTPAQAGYSVIGTVSEAGMTAVQAVADAGLAGDGFSGTPVGAAHVDSITAPDGALDGTGEYPDPVADPTAGLGDLSGLETMVPTG